MPAVPPQRRGFLARSLALCVGMPTAPLQRRVSKCLAAGTTRYTLPRRERGSEKACFLSFPRASVGMPTVSLQRRETARHESFPLLINVNQTSSFCIISGTGITPVFRLIHRPSFDRIDLKLLISFCKSSACAERSRSKRSQSMSLGLVPVQHQSGTSITVRTCPKPVIRLYALNQARVVAGLVDWSVRKLHGLRH